MSLIILGVGWLLSLPYAVLVGGVLVIAALMVMGKWREHMGRIRDPLKQQLDFAAHGTGLAILLPWLVQRAFIEGYIYYLPPEWIAYVWPATYAFMALGVYMLVLGGMRSRTNFHDANLMSRSGIKIGVGFVIFALIIEDVLPPQDWDRIYQHYAFWALTFVAAWCIITGLTKFLLLLRGPPGQRDDEDNMPHGDAGFPPDPMSGKRTKRRNSWFAGWGWR
jgi:hypothetical protein